MMIRFLFAFVCLMSLPCLAQEQEATDTPAEKLKKMQAVEGRLPEDTVTSFARRVVDSTEAPWRTIGRVNVGGRAHCSGALVGQALVLTAAHCLYSKPAERMVVPAILHFVAGYSKGEYQAHSRVKAYYVPPKFDGGRGETIENQPFDWALLELADPIGKTLGFIPLHENLRAQEKAKQKPPTLNSPIVLTAGYPGDRAHVLSLEENCRILRPLFGGHVLITDCVAIKGDSGGPILQKVADGYVIVGVLTAATKVGHKVASMGTSALAFRDKLKERSGQ
ncbi:MAG: trypsin-like serine protease [Alphaproteobacteria bacterium]|nr:trypsin-like serine protease [Alphaproteobacteria bacterium]